MLTPRNLSRLEALLGKGPSPVHNREPNHHLSLRGKVWRAKLTVRGTMRAKRLSRSLHTSSVDLARRRRDALIDALIQAGKVIVLDRRA